MKKNLEFENWIADQMATGLIIMEPYGYREEEEGKYLHIFKLMLQFEDKDEKSPGLFCTLNIFPGPNTASLKNLKTE